jgi:hypothetical protein
MFDDLILKKAEVNPIDPEKPVGEREVDEKVMNGASGIGAPRNLTLDEEEEEEEEDCTNCIST